MINDFDVTIVKLSTSEFERFQRNGYINIRTGKVYTCSEVEDEIRQDYPQPDNYECEEDYTYAEDRFVLHALEYGYLAADISDHDLGDLTETFVAGYDVKPMGGTVFVAVAYAECVDN